MTRKRTIAFMLVLSMLFTFIAPYAALAAEGDIHEDIIIYPIDNGWTQANSSGSVGDTSAHLLISGIGPGHPAATRRHAYLKFDLADINYSEITSAELYWYTKQFSNNTPRVTSIYSLTDEESKAWSGDTITWSNAPDYGVSNADYEGVTPIGSLTQQYQAEPLWGSVDLSEYFKTVEADRTEISFAMVVDTGATYISSIRTGDGNMPYLKITYKEGDGISGVPRSDVTVKTLDNNGESIAEDKVLENLVTGRQYVYDEKFEQILKIDGVFYQFNRENSTLTTEVKDGAEIILSYDKIVPDENGYITVNVPAVDSANSNNIEPAVVQSNNPTILTSSDEGKAFTKADRSAYIKFDLSNLNVGIVSAAELNLYMTSSTNAGTRTVYAYRTVNEWNSETLVWDNAPEATGEVIDEITFPNGETGWLGFDVFKDLSALTNADKEISFRFDTDTGANYFASHLDIEGYHPYIKLTYKEYSADADIEQRDVTIRTVDENNKDIAEAQVVKSMDVGRTYFYSDPIAELIEVEGTFYQYDKSRAVLSVQVEEDGANEILLTYNSLPDGTISSVTVKTLTNDGEELEAEYSESLLWSGDEYFYNTPPVWVRDFNGVKYGYSDSFSNRRITVQPDPDDNVITLLYKPLAEEPTGEVNTATAPVLDSGWAIESSPNAARGPADSIDVSRSVQPEWSDSTAKTAMENRRGFMKFDLANIAYEKIKSAKIVLTVNTSSNSGTRVLYAYPISSAWDSESVTWNNAPLFAGERPVDAAGSILLERMTSVSTAEIDVTPFMENLVGGETEISFMLEVDTASVNLATTGEGTAPYLAIEYYEGEATEADKGTVILQTVDALGNELAAPVVLAEEVAGRVYTYSQKIATFMRTEEGNVYSYSTEESVLSVEVEGNTENYITLVYEQVPIYPGEPAEVTLVAEDNAFVVENAATTVQDNDAMIQLTGLEGAGKSRTNRHGLVKFDTSFIDAKEIESAVLSFFVTSATNTGPRTITIYACDMEWDSKTACWDNAPAYDETKPLGSVEIQQSAGGLYTVDLTEYLKEIKDSLSEGVSFRMVANTAVTEISPIAAGIENAMKLEIGYVAAGEMADRQYKDVKIVITDTDNNVIEEKTEQGIVGREYSGETALVEKFEKNGNVYLYQPKLSTVSIVVSENDDENVISLVYKAYDASVFYTDNILATENAWINESDASLSTNNKDGLLVSNSGGKDPALANRDILLKFDMNYINFSEIVSAKLMFFVDSATNSAMRTTMAYPVSSDWVQGEVSWKNAPLYKANQLIGEVSFTGGVSDWYEIDLTDYMAANIDNNTGDFSIRLAVDTACNYIIPIEEGEGTAPRLVVSYLDDGSVGRKDVTLRITDPEGNKLEDDSIYAENIPIGRAFKYDGEPDTFRQYGGESYVYMAELSTTALTVSEDENILTLVYAKEDSGLELRAEFEVSQNGYTDMNLADSVQDRSAYLLVTKAEGASPALSTRDTFLKFSLAEISFSEIKSATLKIYVNKTGNNTGRTITAAFADSGWDPDTLTWNNAPESGEGIGSVTFNHNATGWYEIDVTEALRGIPLETADVSFALTCDTASSYITSLEVGDGLAPKLDITYVNDGTAPKRERRDVYLSVIDNEGNKLEETTLLEEQVIVGSTYVYKLVPEPYFKAADGTNYMFDRENSALSIKVTADGSNTITIVYTKTEYTGDIIAKTATASDNGFTNSAQPTTVQGTSSNLLTSGMEGSQGANSTRDAFIKFTLPSEEFRYSKIISAKLKLYVQQANNNTTRTTDIYLIEDNTWTGKTVTYDNAPQFGDTGYLGSLSFINGTTGWRELDISNYLGTIDYTDTLSFALRTDTAANYWGSIGSGQAAQLELVYVEGDPVYYERANVIVKTVDENGNSLKDDIVIPKIATGTTYKYEISPAASITIGDSIYTYKKELSTLSVDVVKDESLNNILLVYSLVSPEDIFSGYEITPEGAYCWFADDRAIHYANEDGTIDMTYVGYIDVHGSIKATQYNNLTGEVSEVLIRSNFQPDDHDNPAFLVLPDEHILIIYSRHTDESAFYYRVSEEPGDIRTLGAEKRLATSANTTYPTPFILSEDPDHVYLFWRGTNWHPTMAQLNMPTAENDYTFNFTWGPRQVISSSAQSSGCRPYAKYVSDGKDTIHITYSSTHPDNINPVALYYNAIQITDFTEGNVKVAVKGATGETLTTALPFRVTNNETDPSFVIDDRTTSQRGWVWQIELDSDGIPVVAMVRISADKQLHTYYYAKWDPVGGEWVKTKLDEAGGAFHLSGAEQCYSGGMSIDSETPNIIYGSVPVEGVFGEVYEIIKYTMSDDGREILSREQVTMNSVKNNVRPFSIPGTDGEDEFDLVWMNGDYWYWIVNSSYPNGFPTAIHTNYVFEDEEFDFNDGLTVNYTFDSSSDGQIVDRVGNNSAALNGATVSDGVLQTDSNGNVQLNENIIDSDSFTIAGFVEFDKSSGWGGTPFNFAGGKLKYEVNTSSYIPTLTVGGDSYNSSNLWSNSDWYVNHGATTNGATGTTNPGEVYLAITYDAETGVMRTYINGMADQYVEIAADEIDLSGANLMGQYAGTMRDFRIYDHALTSQQLKKLMKAGSVDNMVEVASVSFDKETNTVSGKIINPKSVPLDAIVYVSVNNAENIVAEVKTESVYVSEQGEAGFEIQLTKNVEETDTIKLYIWNQEMRPITDDIDV